MKEMELAAKLERYCATREIGLRNELVAEHLYLAEMVARRYAGRGVEYDDLYQVASMALIGALERYDCHKNVRFATFATPTLMGVVKNYFRDRSRVIRMPRRIGERMRAIAGARDRLAQENMRQPSVEEIAARCGLTEDEVLEALEAGNAAQVASLDVGVGQEEETELSALMGQEEAEYENIALRDCVQKLLDQLGPAERRIMEARFMQGRTQRDIASEMGVSQMYISRIERRLLKRFRSAILDAC